MTDETLMAIVSSVDDDLDSLSDTERISVLATALAMRMTLGLYDSERNAFGQALTSFLSEWLPGPLTAQWLPKGENHADT